MLINQIAVQMWKINFNIGQYVHNIQWTAPQVMSLQSGEN